MKLTESYLRTLVQEEIQQMISDGELDEGILDFIKGSTGKVGGDIAKKVGADIEKVKKYGAGIARSGQMASLAADLKKSSAATKKLYFRIKKLFPGQYGDLGVEIMDGFEAAIELADKLQKKEITEQNKRKRK
jgi:hypothetical protein|tara:strand:+ start:546 stop:944 length:399 start_codon:yes stop_codon:yes gene_type:complete